MQAAGTRSSTRARAERRSVLLAVPGCENGVMTSPLDPEDAKIVTLARTARLRAYAPHTGWTEGAAVRDTDGRTYAAATMEHVQDRLTVSALRGALSAAVSSGARRLEAAALVRADGRPLCADDLAALAELGADVPLLVAGPDGVLRTTTTAAATGVAAG